MKALKLPYFGWLFNNRMMRRWEMPSASAIVFKSKSGC